jgi:hypothetical protein
MRFSAVHQTRVEVSCNSLNGAGSPEELRYKQMENHKERVCGTETAKEKEPVRSTKTDGEQNGTCLRYKTKQNENERVCGTNGWRTTRSSQGRKEPRPDAQTGSGMAAGGRSAVLWCCKT